MEGNIYKYFTITLLIIIMVLIIQNIRHYEYIDNKELNICQKCIVEKGNYYCQIYGGDK